MNSGATLYALMTGASLFLMAMMTAAYMMLREYKIQDRLNTRLRQIHGEERAAYTRASDLSAGDKISRTFLDIGKAILISGIVPAATKTQLSSMLREAGIRSENAVGVFFGAKFGMLLGLPVVVWLATRNSSLSETVRTLLPFGSAIVGLVLPDAIVKKLRGRFQGRLQKGLPDALDMMVICAQAGLGMAPAVIRVAEEMKESYRELAMEFALTANELQIMSDTRTALQNMGERTGLEQFRRLAMTLIQTIQYGTPLSDALRTLSAEMRLESLTDFEESAARLPTMLTLPMILFILPCVFLIAGGPSIIQFTRHMG